LKFRSEAWVLKKREEQRLEAAEMKFLRHLLAITKLDKEKSNVFGKKTGAENIVKEIKQYQDFFQLSWVQSWVFLWNTLTLRLLSYIYIYIWSTHS